jgi:hypothetical protein
MGKYGIGRNGYPSGRTGAAGRDFYVQSGRTTKARRESNTYRSNKGSNDNSRSSKGFLGSLFGW